MVLLAERENQESFLPRSIPRAKEKLHPVIEAAAAAQGPEWETVPPGRLRMRNAVDGYVDELDRIASGRGIRIDAEDYFR